MFYKIDKCALMNTVVLDGNMEKILVLWIVCSDMRDKGIEVINDCIIVVYKL